MRYQIRFVPLLCAPLPRCRPIPVRPRTGSKHARRNCYLEDAGQKCGHSLSKKRLFRPLQRADANLLLR